MKKCKTCCKDKEASTKDFYNMKGSKDGLQYSCKECWKKRNFSYYRERGKALKEIRQMKKELAEFMPCPMDLEPCLRNMD